MSAVTIGYLSNSSVLSCGKAFFLGVHLLSLVVSPSPSRVAFPRRCICGRWAAASVGRALWARHCDARCEKSWRKSWVMSGESIDAWGTCSIKSRQWENKLFAQARGGLCGSFIAKQPSSKLHSPIPACVLRHHVQIFHVQSCPTNPDIMSLGLLFSA